jgi:hypothetical protein
MAPVAPSHDLDLLSGFEPPLLRMMPREGESRPMPTNSKFPIHGVGGQGDSTIDLDKWQRVQVHGLGIRVFEGPKVVGHPL